MSASHIALRDCPCGAKHEVSAAELARFESASKIIDEEKTITYLRMLRRFFVGKDTFTYYDFIELSDDVLPRLLAMFAHLLKVQVKVMYRADDPCSPDRQWRSTLIPAGFRSSENQ